jgi:hypothetical protein
MNPPPRNILALCVAAALGATWTKAAAPPTRPPAPAPPPLNAPIAAPPGVINGPPLTPAPNATPPRQGLISTGPAPTGFAVSGTPLVANLSWNAMAGAQRYAVYRLDGANLSREVTPAGFSGIQFQDVVPDPRMTYRYVVVAYYPNGTSGESPQVQFLSPPPINPSGFSAHDQGQGTVLFQWQAVPGTMTYRLDGPGLPTTGYVVTVANTGKFVGSPFTLVANIPGGARSWRLVAVYPGNYADYPNGSTASAVVHVLPPHSKTWLTLLQGPGQVFQVQTPLEYSTTRDMAGAYEPGYAGWLGQQFIYDSYYGFYPRTANVNYGFDRPCLSAQDATSENCFATGLKTWLGSYLLWDDPGQPNNEAVYGNPIDIGVGRRSYCEQGLGTAGFTTTCYATAHGPTAGQPGFNDPATITHPIAGIGSDFILSMVITKDAGGTTFMALSKNGTYVLLPSVGLDTEGQKLLPFVCMSCHGGTYNPATRKVDGSSFLPLDPELLAFASPADQAAQEEKIRKINLMIYNSGSSPAITSYVNGLYNGALAQPGAKATPDFVPSGWAPQSGLYRQIVRPYCVMCHMAVAGTDPDLNFLSWTNFKSNDGRIQAAVCGAHTMPHSELQYKAFWLKDTGSLYLPGLLFASLTIPGC